MPTAKNTAPTPATLDHPLNKGVELELVDITPQLASEWLGKNHGNRNQRPIRIDLYERDIRNGNWLVTGESIKFDWNGRMIDGQHRLEAIVGANRAVKSVVVRGLDPAVQKVLDTNARRSASDALGFHGVEVGRSIISTVAKISIAREKGYLQFSLDTSEPAVTHAEVLDWYEANLDVQHAAVSASRLAKRLKSTPGALGYVILSLNRVDAVAASSFLNDLENMRTGGKGDPRFALLRALDIQVTGDARRTNAKQISQYFRAWNAIRDAKSITTLPLEGGNSGPRGVIIPELK